MAAIWITLNIHQNATKLRKNSHISHFSHLYLYIHEYYWFELMIILIITDGRIPLKDSTSILSQHPCFPSITATMDLSSTIILLFRPSWLDILECHPAPEGICRNLLPLITSDTAPSARLLPCKTMAIPKAAFAPRANPPGNYSECTGRLSSRRWWPTQLHSTQEWSFPSWGGHEYQAGRLQGDDREGRVGEAFFQNCCWRRAGTSGPYMSRTQNKLTRWMLFWGW